MPAPLKWDQVGERLFETGVQKGVLYPFNDVTKAYDKGYAWNGLTAVNENPSGGEATDLYANDVKYLSLYSTETLGFTIEAYMSPEEFDECDGSATILDGVTIGQQSRKSFGFCCRTAVGNDVKDSDYGYKLHLYYGCKASPSSKTFSTINDSPEAQTLSWECTTTPVDVENHKPTASVVIDSTVVGAEKMAKIEAVLYGSDSAEARLPLPAEVVTILTDTTPAGPTG